MLEKRLSLRTDFFITGLNGVGTVLGIFVVSGYLARSLGLDALGEYLLVRRTVTASLGVLLFGMNVALPALIAKNEGRGFGESAAVVFSLGTLPLILLIWSVSHFGSIAFPISLPYIVFTIGFCLLTLAYALYRGHLNMVGANLLQLLAGTVVSMAAAFFASSVEQLLLMIGLGMTLISGVAFLQRNRGFHPGRISPGDTAALVKFGLVRVPGLLFQFFLLAGAPLLALTYLSLTDQAFLNAGISLVRSFLMVAGPLGIILLPRVSHAVSSGLTDNLRLNLSVLIHASLFYGALSGFVLSQLSHEILLIWLGEVTNEAARGAMVLLYSVPFFILSAVLRGPIDAGHERGYNSHIYGTGVVVMLVTFFMMIAYYNDPFLSAAGAFLTGHTASGLASFYIARKLFGIPLLKRGFYISLVFLLVVLGFFLELLRLFLSSGEGLLIGSLAVMVSMCGGHLLLSKKEWVATLRGRMGIPASTARD